MIISSFWFAGRATRRHLPARFQQLLAADGFLSAVLAACCNQVLLATVFGIFRSVQAAPFL